MQICLVGKYPPIQGGVARDNFWASFALAQQGVGVHVVTNAAEVEYQYRIFDYLSDHALPPDPTRLAGPHLAVHYSSSSEALAYIPWSNPFTTKLAALATDIVRAHSCQLIYSFYFEPYAIAAYLTSHWAGVPFGVRHAGSDVGRLFSLPEVCSAYAEVIRAADFVFASSSACRTFLRLGVDFGRVYNIVPASLPTQYFHPHAAPLDINLCRAAIKDTIPASYYDGAFHRLADEEFDTTRPTIGIYGKIGQYNGSYELLRALGRLHHEGIAFNLLVLAQGRPQNVRRFLQIVEDMHLAKRVWLMPFIPHWYIPNFIRTCTAICCLERDFPLAIHQSMMPREVLSCGTCLVISPELADKEAYRDRMRSGDNIFLADPRDIAALTATLREIIRSPADSRKIGLNGYRDIAEKTEDFDRYARQLAEIYTTLSRDTWATRRVADLQATRRAVAALQAREASVSRTEPKRSTAGRASQPRGRVQHLRALDREILDQGVAVSVSRWWDLIQQAYCALFRLDPGRLNAAAEQYFALHGERLLNDTIDGLLSFGEYCERVWEVDSNASPYATELARFERLLFHAGFVPTPEDDLRWLNRRAGEVGGGLLSRQARPQLAPGVQVASFGCDVAGLADALRGDRSHGEVSKDIYCLVFQPVPRSTSPALFRVHPVARVLLGVCDGGRTVPALVHLMASLLSESRAERVVVAMLERLLSLGVVQL